ncbi:hypothetical protein F4808DRAFT_453693 [Astrocystis sublimbata]|nr:hypothetical protein F4808DRAFT_453693 [Astrocystis sublimbata]
MADPLSVAGSIVGVLSLADTVLRSLYKYSRSASGAQEEIKGLVAEVEALSGVLHNVSVLAGELEGTERPTKTLQLRHVHDCYLTLKLIEKRVESGLGKVDTSSRIKQVYKTLKWPFSASKTKDLQEDFRRQKETLSLALQTDTLDSLVLCLSKQDETDKKLSAIQKSIITLEDLARIELNEKRLKTLDFLLHVNPQSSLSTSIKLKHPMTGLWLTESTEFTAWIETPGAKMWLSGIPGAGKTVLAGAVIQRCLEKASNSPKTGSAFFFCDYKNEASGSPVNVLGALASQLARQDEAAFNDLQEYYDSLHPSASLPRPLDSEELRDIIIKMSENFDQVLIVVDGLDECADRTDDVVMALLELSQFADRVTMALFSRQLVEISQRLENDFKEIVIAAHTEDITLYVGAEIESRIAQGKLEFQEIGLKDEVKRRLVDKADGM